MDTRLLTAELRKLGFACTWIDTSTKIYSKMLPGGQCDVQLWADGQHRACRTYGTTAPVGFTTLAGMHKAVNKIAKSLQIAK